MAVDKALAQLPQGVQPLDEEGPSLEILIENMGGDPEEEVVIDFSGGLGELTGEFNSNLAEDIDEDSLAGLADELLADFESDVQARAEWIKTYVDGLELLGMKFEERDDPWEGACGVHHPLLSEALVKFQAETMMETFPAQGPVRTQIIGEESKEKKESAKRVEYDMNYQLTERMVEYRPEHERMLWGLGLAGNAFKKVYFDPNLGRQTSMFVPAEDVVVPYGAPNLETAERVCHVMRKTPNEVLKLQADGFYRDIDLGEPVSTLDDVEKKIAERMGFRADTDDRHRILEMHVDIVIAGDEEANDLSEDADSEEAERTIARPYVVTIDKGTAAILSIRRNWLPDDPKKQKRNHFVHYTYVPGFGFYGFGLIHLIGAFAKSSTSLIRQLVDAGTLANLPGGFKTKGLRITGDDTPIGPGEFKDVDVASGTMRDNIMPLPFKEPSNTLYQLLNTIVEEGRRFASAGDMKVSDMSAQAPVGTTLAILERTLKIMSAIQARVHYAMRQEFRLLKSIIRDHVEDQDTPVADQEDYDNVDVLPVSDPNSATMAQKVVQYQAVLQLAQSNPELYNMPLLHRQMLDVLGVKEAEKLVPMDEDEDVPRDPVTENMNVITGKPVRAFMHQDHEAHIAVHTMAMQDPMIMQIVGQNPNAQALMSVMQEHLMEHVAFQYRQMIEDQAGVPYPEPDQDMDEETEKQVSKLAAAAARQVLGANQAKQAQQKAQQAQEDPLVQLQQREMALKEREMDMKEKKFVTDAARDADKVAIEEERLRSQERQKGLDVGVKIATEKAKISSSEQMEGVRQGVQVANSLLQAEQQEKSRKDGRNDKMVDRADSARREERDAEERKADREAQSKGKQKDE